MNKTVTTLLVATVATASLAGCRSTTDPKAKSSDIASSPTPQQLRNNVHDWLQGGGETIVVHLRADLLTTEDGGWQTDPYLAKEVADSITQNDIKPAMGYQGVPDGPAEGAWVQFLSDMNVAGATMEAIGGDVNTPPNKQKVKDSAALLADAQVQLNKFEQRLTQIDMEADK